MESGQFWRENRWARDALVPTALIMLSLVSGRYGGFTILSIALVVPLYWRRSEPEIVFGITVLLALLQLVVNRDPVVGDLAIPLVVHSTAAYARDRAWGWAALGAGLLGSVLGPVFWFGGRGYYGMDGYSQIAVIIAVAMATVVISFLIGRREVSHDRETKVASAERDRLLAVERDQRAEMAAAAERTRIARELHDIVAHSLSVVVVQADGGYAAAKAKPEVAQQVLGTIAETARAALADMRRLVGVLRAGAGPESDHPDYAPAPTAADVPELVDQLRRAGLPAELMVVGTERELPPGVGLTVYRVVQESLTNVIKHAGPGAKAEVALVYGDNEIQLTVLDDGRGAAAFGDGLGNGLTGMRERVGLLGGTVAAHPRPGGGFLVTASLPTAEPGHRPGKGPDRR
ncbi:sensor histidine kinase [Nakamurella lactea]|uniref:sensor histidine kinase n=1 Tax=Nakamurella lactea TaxID=459515 RepID=UPI000685F4BD|nr:sensor histidine kinase [Nakamurella lactea]